MSEQIWMPLNGILTPYDVDLPQMILRDPQKSDPRAQLHPKTSKAQLPQN